MQVPPALRETFPFFSLSSSIFLRAPALTSKYQPSGEEGSTLGSTQAFLPSFVESMKEETSGTIAPFAAGSGERTVRAHSHAMTVASAPSESFTLGYRLPIRLSASSRSQSP